MPFTTRAIEGKLLMERAAGEGGYGTDIAAFRDALKDLADGLDETCTKHKNGSADNWGTAAQLHVLSMALHHLMAGMMTGL